MTLAKKLGLTLFGLALWIAAVGFASAGVPVLSPLVGFLVAAVSVGLLFWLLVRVVRRLLWRVGRRLAFSYFLIGVLPIPMVLVLLGLGLYLQSGFFLSHLYRDAVRGLEAELHQVARAAATGARLTPPEGVALAFYDADKLVAGDPGAPAAWPSWIPGLADPEPHGQMAADPLPLAALADGRPTVVAGSRGDQQAVLAFFTADLTAEMVRRTRMWVELTRPGDESQPDTVRLQFFGRRVELTSSGDVGDAKSREQFFSRQLPELEPGTTPRWIDRPVLFWVELHGPFRALSTGQPVAEALTATLNTTPRGVVRRLYSGTAEVDTTAWAALFGVSVLLAEIYLAAVGMAIFMIFSLSRAVNRLSAATEAVKEGDFSFRIPTQRKDQLGDLQRSFNRMAENLESLVATAAQKEALETELELAREVQQSLLPAPRGEHERPGGGTRPIPRSDAATLGIDPERVTFATHFVPSAAIGGDYYDILRLAGPAAESDLPGIAGAGDRVAVMIADVSGHGLSAGLRMAMIKAALTILVEDGHPPAQIFTRLDHLVRQRGDTRAFVTATLALLDVASGRLDLINAGHPPTYLARRGEIREVMLPSRPLGGLARRGTFAHQTLLLEPDDVLVWLSDGLIEATNHREEAFGYDRLMVALSGAPPSASGTRDRLLRAVRDWCGSRDADDDQTLVVMRWVGPPGT
jgi:serine phosphatase RsbU (regulator of sigma subunit)